MISNAFQIAGEMPGVVDCTASQVTWGHSSVILIFSSEEQNWPDRDQVLFTALTFSSCVSLIKAETFLGYLDNYSA